MSNNFERPSWDEYFLAMAAMVSTRSTCLRRMVGCVLVDWQHRVLATGYNGTAPFAPHCTDTPCDGAFLPSGTGLERCESSHAEISALADCRDRNQVTTIYCTTAPCTECVKALLLTGAMRLVFIDDYPGSEESRRRWERAGREWIHFEGETWQRVLELTSSRWQWALERRQAAERNCHPRPLR